MFQLWLMTTHIPHVVCYDCVWYTSLKVWDGRDIHGNYADKPILCVCVIQGSELISKKVSPPSDKLDSPVLAFVSLEHYNAVRLVQAVHSSLADLNKVLRGSALLTTDVQRLASALLRHEVRLTVITGLEWWWVRESI